MRKTSCADVGKAVKSRSARRIIDLVMWDSST
jgi:hypothetical protein